MTELENNNHFKPRYETINPFKHKLNLNTYNYFKLTFMSIFVMPFRILFIFLSLFTAYVIVSVALVGVTEEDLQSKPLTGWRSKFRWTVYALGRCMIRFYGYTYVNVKGKCAPASEAPIIVSAPHTSFFDAIAVWWSSDVCPGVVSRVENNDLPLLGKCIRFVQSVHVEREAEKSRKSSVTAIINRVHSKEPWPPIMIFPEGTCTNGKSLISFKLGAFLPGVPVQPLVIRYFNKNNYSTWTSEGPGAVKVIWVTLCQFASFCEIEYLPVYEPNMLEKQNAQIFARNVRKVMAKALDIPVTEYSFEDAKMIAYVKQYGLPSKTGLIEFQILRQEFRIDLKVIKEDFLSQFAKMSNKNGLVDIHGFANGLNLPISEPLVVKLFNIYDEAGRGTLNFKEYIYGRCTHTQRFTDEVFIQKAYSFFDLDANGFRNISSRSFSSAMMNSFNVPEDKCLQILSLTDFSDASYVTEDGLKKLAKIAPEYIWILCECLRNGNNRHLERNSQVNILKAKEE